MLKRFKTYLFEIICTCCICIFSSDTNAQIWSSTGNGLDNNVYSFAKDTINNLLYVGGHFSNSGSLPVERVGKWDGTNWLPLGMGMNQDVYAVSLFNNELYAGGHFTTADGNPCNYIAKWDGTAWQPVGSGMNNDVYYLAVYNGELYAGGIFTTADGNPANRIAKWNGVNWSAAGTGISGTPTPQVFSMQEYNGELFVTGQFDNAGGTAVNNIAKWDGTDWSDVGGGLLESLQYGSDLIVYNNNLVVTGSFLIAGTDTVNGIAKWNGSSWSGFGTGLAGAGGFGVVLAVYNGELYVGGNFTSVNGVNTNRIARYNEINSWRDLGVGCDQEVDALEAFNGELFVGGLFYNGGGIGLSKIGRWSSGCTAATVVTGQNVSCMNICDGSASLSVVGNYPFTYLWSGGEITSSVSGLCAGSYSVTVTDSSGCTATDSVVIQELPLATLVMQGISPVCYGQCNGNASVVATGLSPFTYNWSTNPVQVSDTASGICAGTYFVTVTDSVGCSVMDSIIINDPPLANLSFSVNVPNCPGRCDGSATVNSSSLNSPFTYNWLTVPIQNTQTATNLCAGKYLVAVVDSLGCLVLDSVIISDPSPSSLSFSTSNPNCPLSCDGIASVSSTSSFTPFTYFWNTSPSQNSDTIYSLCEGVYTVTVTDALGCTAIDSVTISDPVITLDISFTNATCAGGGCDGSAKAIASGNSAFTYLWSNSASTDSIINLCPGTYTVTATDLSGCIITDSVAISSGTPPTVNLTPVSTLCFADCNGSISVAISGNSPFSYLWSTSETTDSINGLCSGWYSITVTDSLACTTNDSVFVLQPDPITIAVTNALDISCFGECDGAISITASGGTPTYSYLWSNNSSFSDQFNLCADSYTLTVTDINNCTKQSTVTLSQPDTLIVELSGTDATCPGCNDGVLSSTVSGGTPTYNYFFTPPVADPNHVSAGIYFLCVTDINGCQSCDSAIISEPTGIFEISNSETKLSVHPNPFNSSALLKLPEVYSISDNLIIKCFDVVGKEVVGFSYHTNKKNKNEIVVERQNLTAGIYIFKVTFQDKTLGTGRFIVE